MKQHLLLATAGHIDHGKTALVKALTGVETDRLPDEKRRQITIDLGFAPLELAQYQIGIVDVPGHERFVRNMLAGATGVDLALLVVAADDSVKPQTREHLEILEYLSLEAGVIAITKCDLAEADWIDLVEAEIRELVAGTRLESAPIVRVSAQTGQGIEQLRDELASAADLAMERRPSLADAPFRMAIDRAFTISGHGTVVTGSVASGQVGVGDELELQPQGVRVRIRGLQSHDTAVQQVGRGQRAAVNLSGIHYDEISRGQSLAKSGALRPSRILSVTLRVSEQVSRPVKHRTRVRLHVGTSEALGTLSLLGRAAMEPGEESFAQVFLSEDVAIAWGQPFVIRGVSPLETLGGGRILDVAATKIRRLTDAISDQLSNLESNDPLQRAAAGAFFADCREWQPADLFVLAGVEEPQQTVDQLIEEKVLRRLTLDNGNFYFLHSEVFRDLSERIEKFLGLEHRKTPLNATVERTRLKKYSRGVSEDLWNACLAALQKERRIVIHSRGLALADWSPDLSQREQDLLMQIIEAHREAKVQPPSAEQLAKDFGERLEIVESLLPVAIEQGLLVRINGEMLLHCDAEQQARDMLVERMRGGAELSLSEIRELLDTSRKFAVPYCEYLDEVGFTRRVGNQRILVKG